MRTLRIIGVLGVSVILLSAGIAFAEDRPVSVEKRTEVREEAKAKVEAQREEAKKKIDAQREKAKQRLSDIRDKKKQELALKLASQFEALNKKWTDRFTQQLDKLSAVVLKIQERADIAAINGKDVTAVKTAIQSANTAIATAQTAVTAQAAKIYALDTSAVTTMATPATSRGQDELIKSLRTQFQNMHKTLFKDLYALRDGVMKNARKVVQDALQTLNQIPKVDDDNSSATDDSAQ